MLHVMMSLHSENASCGNTKSNEIKYFKNHKYWGEKKLNRKYEIQFEWIKYDKS